MRNGYVLRQIKQNQITYKSIKFASESKAVGHICLLNTGDLCPLSPVLLRAGQQGKQKRALMVTISISSKKVVLMNGAHSTGG